MTRHAHHDGCLELENYSYPMSNTKQHAHAHTSTCSRNQRRCWWGIYMHCSTHLMYILVDCTAECGRSTTCRTAFSVSTQLELFFFIFFVAAYRNTLSTSMECSIREDWWIFIASSLLMTSAQINIKIVQCMVASTKNNIHFIGHVAASPTSISIQLKCRNST